MEISNFAITTIPLWQTPQELTLDTLPKEMLTLIFSRLSVLELYRLGGVSKKLSQLMPKYFKQLVERKWEHILSSVTPSDSEWKNIALRQETIENNMLKGKYTSFEFPKVGIDHHLAGNKCVFRTNMLSDLEIWDLQKKTCLTKIESIESATIFSFILFKDLLVVAFIGSIIRESYIKLWNIHTGKQLHRLENIWAYRMWKFDQVPYLFVSTFDNLLSMWDIESGKKLWEVECSHNYVPEVYDQMVRCYDATSRSVKWLDIKTGKKLEQLSEKMQEVISFTVENNQEYMIEKYQFDDDLVFAKHRDRIDIFKNGKKAFISSDQAFIENFLLSKDKIVTLDNEGCLQIWDRQTEKEVYQKIDTGEKKDILNLSRTTIWKIVQLSSSLILTSSNGRKVLWNMETRGGLVCPELSFSIILDSGKFISNFDNKNILIDYSIGAPPVIDPPLEPSPNNLYEQDFFSKHLLESINHSNTFSGRVSRIISIFHRVFINIKSSAFTPIVLSISALAAVIFGGMYILLYLNRFQSYECAIYNPRT